MSGKITMRNNKATMKDVDVLDDSAIGWDTDAAWDLIMDDNAEDDESIFADFDDLEPIPMSDHTYTSFGGDDDLVGDDESSVTSTTTCYQPAVATLPLPSSAYQRHTAVSLCSGRSRSRSRSSSGSNRSHTSGSSSVTSTSLESQVDGNLTALQKKLADSMKRSTETRVALQQSMKPKSVTTSTTETNKHHAGTTTCPHDDNGNMDYRMRQFQTSMTLVAQSNKVVAQQGSSTDASHAPPRAGNKDVTIGSPLSCTTAAKTMAAAIVSPTSVTYATSSPLSPSSPYHGHYRNRQRRRSSTFKTKPWNSSKHTRRALLQMKQALRAAKHATHLTCCIDSPITTPKSVTPKVLVPASSWTMSPMNQSPLSTTARHSSMTAFLKQNYPNLYASSQKSQQSRPTATTTAVAGAAASSSSSSTTTWTHSIDTNAKRRCSLL